MKECPEDLKSCIATLIWSANRVDIPELQEIRKQFRYKYGKKFEEACLNNVGGMLNERVVAKLSVQPPSAYLVQTYLEKIADEFEVDWKPAIKLGAEDLSAPMVAPVGYSVQIAPGTGLAPAGVPPPSNPEMDSVTMTWAVPVAVPVVVAAVAEECRWPRPPAVQRYSRRYPISTCCSSLG